MLFSSSVTHLTTVRVDLYIVMLHRGKPGLKMYAFVTLSGSLQTPQDQVMVVVFLSLSLHHFVYFIFPVRGDLSQASPGQFPFWEAVRAG